MTTSQKSASIYRMVMPEHTCPYGLKALDLLRRRGFEVEDHWLKTRAETDAFKVEHDVETTPHRSHTCRGQLPRNDCEVKACRPFSALVRRHGLCHHGITTRSPWALSRPRRATPSR